jgi:glycosyltransferase involved in cell wall biosynthesis
MSRYGGESGRSVEGRDLPGAAPRRDDAPELPEARGPVSIAFFGDPGSLLLPRWLNDFAGRGHEVHLFVERDRPAPATLDPRVGVVRFESFGRRFGGPGTLRARRSLRAGLAAVKPDVVHAHSVTRHGWAAALSGFHPYVVTVWGSDVLVDPARSAWTRLLARWVLGNADLVTGGSTHLVEAAVRRGARPDRARYVHFGVDTAAFTPDGDTSALRSRLRIGKARVIFSPRVIRPLYRQDVIVDAFARLPADTRLVMTRLQAAESELAAIEARTRALGVADRTVIVPAIDPAEMADFYRLSDVVVSVPVSDGGPNTLVEALACGRPVVSSDLPPNREWLADLDPQALVPVGDVAATAGAIETILRRSDSERAERAARGRSAVCERADRRAMIDRMEAIYRDLASRRRAAG